MEDLKNILILCTGNSCRSQIAHGFLENMLPDVAVVKSAGIETHGLNPGAVKTMNEIGIDISHHTSNHMDEYADIKFDYLITVCDHAHESCPVFSNAVTRIHMNFPDPAKATGSEEEIDAAFRHTRNLIKTYLEEFVTSEFKNQ